MYDYDRRFAYRTPTEGAQKWAAVFRKALEKLGARVDDFKLAYGGNVRSFLNVEVNGKPVPEIVIEEELLRGPNYKQLKWVRVDQGSSAKFIKAPTKMAVYVLETYG